MRPILGRPSAERGHWNSGSVARTQPVLQNQGSSQGFSRFWPIALAVCSAHATRCMAPAALAFRVAHRNSSRFSRSAGSEKHWGFEYPSLPKMHAGRGAVGFELSVPCSGERLDSRIHENDERLTVFLTILTVIPSLRIPRHCPCRGGV